MWRAASRCRRRAGLAVAEPDGSFVQRVRVQSVVALGNSESGLDVTAEDIALKWYFGIDNGEADILNEI